MEGKRYSIEICMLEPMLGTVPKNEEIYAKYIASKAALTDDEVKEELESVASVEEKGWTGFHTNKDGDSFIYNYMIKGFFKNACSVLRRSTKHKSSKIQAFKKIITGLVFVHPRKIPLILHGKELFLLERPQIVTTQQGQRSTVARSDACPVGTNLRFEVEILPGGPAKTLLAEWLDYGQYVGLGQWRGAAYGSFSYKFLPDK